MKFRPLQDRVLIRRIEEEEKTKGGIIIPDTAKEKPMEGEVIAAGPGTRSDDGKLHPLAGIGMKPDFLRCHDSLPLCSLATRSLRPRP